MDVYQPSTLAMQAPPARAAWYRLPVLLLILAVLVAVAFFPYYLEQVKYRQTRAEVAAINGALPELKIGSMGKLFTLLARKVSPSVVHIETDSRSSPRKCCAWGPRIRQQQGEAFGVIVDEEGYIVTNYHVVANTDEIHVRLPDGRTRDAELHRQRPKERSGRNQNRRRRTDPRPLGQQRQARSRRNGLGLRQSVRTWITRLRSASSAPRTDGSAIPNHRTRSICKPTPP